MSCNARLVEGGVFISGVIQGEGEKQLARTKQNAMTGLVHQNVGQHGPAVTDGVHLEVVVLAGHVISMDQKRLSPWTDLQDSHSLQSVSEVVTVKALLAR
jgi:hypothetical protein